MRFGGRVWESGLEPLPKSPQPRDADGGLDRLQRLGLLEPPGLTRSCCCVAQAQVRVLLPVPGDPDRVVDLLLCGHHYRQHAERLARLGARIIPAPKDHAVRQELEAASV